ncbi:uncharacterized protein LOC144177860 [Haemaphysalis longicornis]
MLFGLVFAILVLGMALAYAMAALEIGVEDVEEDVEGKGGKSSKSPDDADPIKIPTDVTKRRHGKTIHKELICTVGADAVLQSMYPGDGLCDYLYYTELTVDGKLTTAWQDKGWLMFQKMLKSMSNTAGGIAFDIHYVSPDALGQDAVVEELGKLAEQKVAHYGLLNVIAHHSGLAGLLQKAQTLLGVMKGIQANHQGGKTILAMGLHDYSDPSAWNTYKDLFKRAVEVLQVDTVIAISSSGYFDTEGDCKALPVSAITSHDSSYPSLDRVGELVKEDFEYGNKFTAVVGLSYQLGVLTYQLEQGIDDVNQIAYSKCVGRGLGDQEILCDNNNRYKDLAFGRVGFVVDGDKEHVYIGDIKTSVTDKANYIKNIGVRNRFSWLVFNVHLTILRENMCLKPFEVLQAIRDGLNAY